MESCTWNPGYTLGNQESKTLLGYLTQGNHFLMSRYSMNVLCLVLLTINIIIPRTRLGSESIGYRLRGHKGERNDCFSKIQLVGQKY